MNQFERGPAVPNPEKQQRWEKAREWVESIKDELGKPIDENIKEAVIALKAFGINTFGSCEGHLDRGDEGPYLDIQSPEVPELEMESKATESATEKKRIVEEIERKNLEERQKLMPYLDEFYGDREGVFYGERLVIQNMAQGWTRVESQGVSLQRIESDDVKQQRLQAYQEEMRAFAEFLKGKFFEQAEKTIWRRS